jgi:hypothetical protein
MADLPSCIGLLGNSESSRKAAAKAEEIRLTLAVGTSSREGPDAAGIAGASQRASTAMPMILP